MGAVDTLDVSTGARSQLHSLELQRKEQELAELRSRTLQSLEQQLAARDVEHNRLVAQFEQLKADFTYNLELLGQRDEELAAYDSQTAAHQQTVQQQVARVAELELTVLNLQDELRGSRAAAQQQEFVLNARCAELAAMVEEERLSRSEALMRAREQADAARGVMQRELEETRQQMERQRRSLSAAFEQQLEDAQRLLRGETEELKKALATSKAVAHQQTEELKQAGEREAHATQMAETLRAALRERDVTLRGLELELEGRARQHDTAVRDLQQRLSQTEGKLKEATDSYEGHRSQLASQLAVAQACLDDLRTQCMGDVALLQRRHAEEVAAVRAQLEGAAGRAGELEQEGKELRLQLRTTHAEMQELMLALEAQLEKQRVAVETASRQAAQQARDEEAARHKAAVAERDKEVQELRQLLTEAKASLEEQEREINSLQEQIKSSVEGEKALMRRLRGGEDGRTQQPPEQQQMQQPGQGTSKQPPGGRPTALSLAGLQESHDSLPDFAASPLLDLPPSPRSSASFWLGPATGPGGQQQQQQQQDVPRPWSPAAAAAAAVAAASRAAQYLRSSREGLDALLRSSNRSRLGLVDSGGQQQQPKEGAGTDGGRDGRLAQLEEAERENARLRSTLGVMRAEMEALQRAAGAAADSVLAGQQQQQQQTQGYQAPGAWEQGPGLSPRRDPLFTGEAMEDIDEARAELAQMAAGAGRNDAMLAAPDVRALQVELEEGDRDLQQALEHVELLQRQVSALRAAAAGTPTATAHAQAAVSATVTAAAAAELSFLRRRVKELTAANRVLRRRAMQQLASATAAAAVAAAGGGPAGALQENPTTSDLAGGAAQESSAQQDQPPQEDQGQDSDAEESSPVSLESLRSQLAAARAEAERLMELSSEVRSQRDRYAMQLVALLTAGTAAPQHAPDMPPHMSAAMRQPHHGAPAFPQGPGHGPRPASATAGPSPGYDSPPHYSTPPPTRGALGGLQSQAAVPMLQPAGSPLALAMPVGAPGALWPYGAANPLSAGLGIALGLLGQHGLSWLTHGSTHALSGSGGVGGRQSPGVQDTHREARRSEGGTASRSPSPTGRRSPGGSPSRRVEFAQPLASALKHTQYTADTSSAPGVAPVGPPPEGPTVTSVSANMRPNAPPGVTASGRETQSQRAALRALHRRREQHQQQAVAAAETVAAVRQRVRNYSFVRDEGDGPMG